MPDLRYTPGTRNVRRLVAVGAVAALAVTLASCSDSSDAPDLADQDAWLATFLEGSPALELSGSTLTLGDDTEGIVLEETD